MALRSLNEIDSITDVSIPLDVRGWRVQTLIDREKVGSVHDVLIDTDGAARYLDVELGLFKRHVLLPVGQGVVDQTKDVVWVQAMRSDAFEHIPAYAHDLQSLDAVDEQRLINSYDEHSAAARYDRPEYGGAVIRDAGQDEKLLGASSVELRRLSNLGDYTVAEDDPDPRGWALLGRNDERLGEVDDLVVDPKAMKARYLDVSLGESVLGGDRGARVLVPVGYARVDAEDKKVRVPFLSRDDAEALPVYRDEFDDDYEDIVERSFARRHDTPQYAHPRYDAERLYSTRMPEPLRRSRRDAICDVGLRR